MKNVVQPFKKFKKNTAVDIRKKGLSYSAIQKRLHVPKSTLSLWLKNVELTEQQVKNLKDKRLQTAKENSRKRILKTSRLIEEIKNSSAKDIREISKKELWLMGVVLYWRERASLGNERDIKNGVRFTSSDPNLVKLFIKWLKELGGIEKEEIKFDLFLGEDKKSSVEAVKEAVLHWSRETGFPKEDFLNHIYFQKNSPRRRSGRRKRGTPKKSQLGILRIRVRASSMLARQIAGWIQGIQRYYWGPE